jgi:chromosomal replication initiator protein
MQAERLWQAALGQVQLEIPRASYETWVRDAELLAYEDGEFIIGVRNAYARDWLEGRLLPTFKRILAGLADRTVGVRFVVWQDDATEGVPALIEASASAAASQFEANRRLNARYSFESFVVGSSNRLAHAAAQAVAESPARAYNPLFLYGGVGLGKTHLLHAVGHACTQLGLQVLYVSSEEFTNDLINAIRMHTTDAFRERYRRSDVLLVDDIQFIAGKESTQEEFFHTFNTLHGTDRQLVISSDRPPKAMVTLEERLRSRFEWGLTVDIQAPDLETRVAILRLKADRAGRHVDPVFMEQIARRVQSNIRELEGALTRVLAYSDLTGQAMSSEMVDMALADLAPRPGMISADQILEAVASHYGVGTDALLGRGRSKDIALPRQVAMYLIRQETHASLPQIGAVLGGRDHTTVLYGCEKIGEQIETDEPLRRSVMAIRDSLRQPFHAVT